MLERKWPCPPKPQEKLGLEIGCGTEHSFNFAHKIIYVALDISSIVLQYVSLLFCFVNFCCCFFAYELPDLIVSTVLVLLKKCSPEFLLLSVLNAIERETCC